MALCGHFVHPQGAQQVEPVMREGSAVSVLWVPVCCLCCGQVRVQRYVPYTANMGTGGSGDNPQSLPGKVVFISKVRGRLERVAVRIAMEQILLCPSVGRLWCLPLELDDPKGCPFTAPLPGRDRVPVPSLIPTLMASWRGLQGN